MKKLPLISVIIPFFNDEKYLENCLYSVLNQDYRNIEVILINDGSFDNSSYIAEKFAKSDHRIRILKQKNSGQGAARNKGIVASRGDFITFVDADDYVNKDYVSFLYSLIEDDNFHSPLSICSYTELYQDYNSIINKGNDFAGILNGKQCLERMLYEKQVNSCAYTKLARRELFFPMPFFPETRMYEDLGAIYKLFLRAKTVACGFSSKYVYRIHTGSTLSKSFSKDNLIASQTIDYISKEICKVYPELAQAAQCYQVSIRLSLVNQLSNNPRSKSLPKLTSFIRHNQLKVLLDGQFNRSKKVAIILLNFNLMFYYYVLRKYSIYKRGKK